MSLLEVRDISKRFGDFAALDSVSLEAPRGAALALLGENGAGKSTLMKVCYGMLRPDKGALLWEGRPVHLSSPADARALGIGMVHQHFTLVPAMTVAENLALAAPPIGRLSPKAIEDAAVHLSERVGISVDPRAVAGRLPVGMQQRVEILKALSTSAKLLILDEPTAVLAPPEVADLFTVLAHLRDQGTGIILITHKLPEALALADRVAVLRRGRVVLTADRADVDADTLARAMVGRSLVPPAPLPPANKGGPVLAWPSPSDTQEVSAGETVGIAGVEGNGQTEMAETLVGLRQDFAVSLDMGGALANASAWSVGRRIAWGLAHIPEDRHATALALSMPVEENLFLAGDAMPHRGIWIDRRAAQSRASSLAREYDVRASSLAAPIGSLSGGNQQKAVVARELSRRPRLLVAVNPTRGLDVAATEFVHDAIRAHRARGGATLLVSSELDELLALSDRILVMYGGRIVGAMHPGQADDRDRLGRMMTGAGSEGRA